ncbi:hypothetical protein LCGC14_2267800 [marine sediment metagenome]|uniref:SLA1 homology domain-containing protein n=1 Tax=marine sediment metagenome TaxID=412755 RepID=A0A0F9DK34_9ZZZZ
MEILICLLCVTWADAPMKKPIKVPLYVAEYLARSESDRKTMVALLTIAIKRTRGDQAKNTQRQLDALQSGDTPFLADLPGRKPAVGDVGRLPSVSDRQFRVIQVIDGLNAIISLRWHNKQVRIINGSPVVEYGRSQKVTAWIRGISTENFSDDTVYTDGRVFHVSGTRTYASTDGGTNTVLVLQPLDVTPFLRPIVQDEGVPRPPPGIKVRTWRAATGGFSVEAIFVKVSAGQVTLRKLDGTEITLPMARLSEADQQWIKKPHLRE